MIKKTGLRMTLCVVCLLLILTFIWGNSLLPGTQSGALSDIIKELLRKLFPFLFSGSGSGGGGLLRKIAHFTEFSLLGACLGWLFGMLRSRWAEQIVSALLCGILVACIDETIQRFVPGRHGCLPDVGIDSAGVAAGILLFTAGYLIFTKTKPQYLEELK